MPASSLGQRVRSSRSARSSMAVCGISMRNGEMPSPFSDVVRAAFTPCESTTFSSLHGAGRTPVPFGVAAMLRTAPPAASRCRRMTRVPSRRVTDRQVRSPCASSPSHGESPICANAERIAPFHYSRTECFVPCILRDMNEEIPPRLPGRQSQAARNDGRILEAAREVFTADPNAPISAVAERAGVGISALYRRYQSKEELLQQLSLEGLRRYIAEAEAALADEGDPWEAFAGFMRRCVDAGTSSITRRLAGRFTPTEQLNRDGRRAYEVTQALLHRTKAAGPLREDVEVADLSLLFEALQGIEVADPG